MRYIQDWNRRRIDGAYEATYEINASLQMSFPEFQQLVSHEVVPGHVTTSAYLQNLYVRGVVGFEATVLTMNTRAASLFEGIANNAILIAHGVTEVEQLPDKDMQIGVLLALLQDDAKNQADQGRRGAGPRFSGQGRTGRQAVGGLGEASAIRPYVFPRVPRWNREGGGTPPAPSCRACAARNLRLQRAGGYRNCGAGCGRKLEAIKNFSKAIVEAHRAEETHPRKHKKSLRREPVRPRGNSKKAPFGTTKVVP